MGGRESPGKGAREKEFSWKALAHAQWPPPPVACAAPQLRSGRWVRGRNRERVNLNPAASGGSASAERAAEDADLTACRRCGQKAGRPGFFGVGGRCWKGGTRGAGLSAHARARGCEDGGAADAAGGGDPGRAPGPLRQLHQPRTGGRILRDQLHPGTVRSLSFLIAPLAATKRRGERSECALVCRHRCMLACMRAIRNVDIPLLPIPGISTGLWGLGGAWNGMRTRGKWRRGGCPLNAHAESRWV